jgi:phosphoglycerate dehydrogenase-like enzyme
VDLPALFSGETKPVCGMLKIANDGSSFLRTQPRHRRLFPMSDAPIIVTDVTFTEDDQRMIREAAGPEAQLICVNDVAALRRALGTATVLCTFRPPSDIETIAPHLRWLQYPGAGIDTLIEEGVLHKGVRFVVTTVGAANAEAVAEYVLGAMLIFARRWNEMLALQRDHAWASGRAWHDLRGVELRGQTLGIVGFGAIGRRVAQIGRAFGMRVLATRRTEGGATDPDCDALFPATQMAELMGESDFVLLSLPRTPETTGLIGERELRAMRSKAFLINIARGEVIQEPVLVRALRERWIAGAALDVTAQEPLPRESPLWTMPGVLITPHMSGLTTGYTSRVAELLADNLRRLQRGEPLLNLVNFDAGY